MKVVYILGLGGAGNDIRSYISIEYEDCQYITICDDLDTENRKSACSDWSALLAEGLEKVYESVTSKMRSMVSDCPYHCDFVRYHEHTYTAPMKSWNVVNSQFSVQVNHINLPTSSIARAFRSLCSNRCMLWNGAAALRRMREQSNGNYRFREGFQLQNRIVSISCKWRNRFLELMHICDAVFLMNKPSTVRTALALC